MECTSKLSTTITVFTLLCEFWLLHLVYMPSEKLQESRNGIRNWVCESRGPKAAESRFCGVARKCRNLAAKFFLRPKSKTRPHFKCEMHFYAHPKNFRLKYWKMLEKKRLCPFFPVFWTYYSHFGSFWDRNWLRDVFQANQSYKASLIKILIFDQVIDQKLWNLAVPPNGVAHPYMGIAFWLITQPFFVQFQKERYPRTQDINSYR